MKKIILCGATHGSNFGDSLFAYVFEKYMKSIDPELDIYFTRVSEYSKEFLNIKKASIRDIFSAKGLLFISGGYFGEAQHETWKGRIYHLIFYYIYGVFMAVRRKPIAIIGVGAGPLDSLPFKKLVLYIFKHAKVITLRDEESKQYMMNYGCTNEITVTSDSAQILNRDSFNNDITIPSDILNEKIKDRKKVLIHITEAPGHELFEDKIIEAISETLMDDNEIAFILTNDTMHDVRLKELMEKRFPKNRTIIYQYSDPFEFLGLIKSVDSIITPKLHLGILGATYGKPVLSFPIHPDKTARYFKQIGYDTHCHSLYDVTIEQAKFMIEKYLWEKVNLSDEILINADLNFKKIDKFLDDYIS